MNKRLLSILLSALLAANISACAPVSPKEIDTDPLIENADPNPPADRPTDDEISLSSVGIYQGVLDIYRELLLLKQNHSDYAELYTDNDQYDNEIATEIFHTVTNNSPNKMGYSLKDLNNDGVNELILLDENYHIYTIFTSTKGQIKAIEYASFFDSNHIGAIGPDGTIYKNGYGKGENVYSMAMKISEEGELVGLQFGCLDADIDDTEVEYYKTINGERIVIDYDEFAALNEEYYRIVGNHTDLTRNSGINFIRMPLERASFDSYESIISTYRRIVELSILPEKLNEDRYFMPLNEQDLDLYNKLCTSTVALHPHDGSGLDPNCYHRFGYTVKDLNGDGTAELILRLDNHEVIAIFTKIDGKPTLVDYYWNRKNCWIDSDGYLHVKGSIGADKTANQIYRLSHQTGELTLLAEGGTDGHDETSGNTKYYKLLENKKVYFSEEEYSQWVESLPYAKFDATASLSEYLTFVCVFDNDHPAPGPHITDGKG